MVHDAYLNSTSSNVNISLLIQSSQNATSSELEFDYEKEVSKYVLPPCLLIIFVYIVVSCSECPRVRRMRRGIEAKRREARLSFIDECIVTKQVYSHDLARIFESSSDAEENSHLPSLTSSSSEEGELEIVGNKSKPNQGKQDEESYTASAKKKGNEVFELCLPCDSTNEGDNSKENTETANEREENNTIKASECGNSEDTCNIDEETGNSHPCCAICLEEYVVGEQVSWSRNATTSKKSSSSCDHVYHHQCIRQWLVSNEDCPCCREKFMGNPRHTNKSSTNGDTEGSDDIDEDAENRRRRRALTRFFEQWQKFMSIFTSHPPPEDQKEQYQFCVIHGLVEPDHASYTGNSSFLPPTNGKKKALPQAPSAITVETSPSAKAIKPCFAEV